MSYIERAPLDRIKVALHEAGHALTCLVVGCQIDYWMLLADEDSVRMNRRIRKKSHAQEGTGCIVHAMSPHDLHIILSGEASECIREFIADDVRTVDEIADQYGDTSDQYDAWVAVREAHAEQDVDIADPDIRRK